MKALVTGGAGFIGSRLCGALCKLGHRITILDNFSTGNRKNIDTLLRLGLPAKLVTGDCKDPLTVKRALREIDTVFHLAADPEVRLEKSSSSSSFRENVYATHVILEAMKKSAATHIVFASSSTVYGDARMVPTPETYGPLEPISVYGASKLASEAILSGYAHSYQKKATILRLANVVGDTNKRGVVPDFLRQLKDHPNELRILGNGHQCKSYLHVDDCISAILQTLKSSEPDLEVFNIGSEDQIEVLDVARTIIDEVHDKDVRLKLLDLRKDGRGWNGDVRNMLLDVGKLKSRGWRPRYSSLDAVRETARSVLGEKHRRRFMTEFSFQ